MADITNEMKEKLLVAKSAEEAAALLTESGVDETTAKHLWEELNRKREANGGKLSLDELEAVSGGADRDWLTEGCANLTTTSYCWTGLDYCDLWDVTYTHEPFAYPCRYCGRDNAMYQASDTGYTDGLSCKFCHASDNKQLLKDYWAAHPRIAHQA